MIEMLYITPDIARENLRNVGCIPEVSPERYQTCVLPWVYLAHSMLYAKQHRFASRSAYPPIWFCTSRWRNWPHHDGRLANRGALSGVLPTLSLRGILVYHASILLSKGSARSKKLCKAYAPPPLHCIYIAGM
jgi:hypothetical protein